MPKQNEVEIKLRLDPGKMREFANSDRLAGVDPLRKMFRSRKRFQRLSMRV
jgi:hypothetical protein